MRHTAQDSGWKRLLPAIGAGVLCIACSVISPHVQAQVDAAPSAAFEVASVRATPAGGSGLTSVRPSGAVRFTATNVSLAFLLQMAFGVDGYQMAGSPAWLESQYYDIAAEPEDVKGLTYDQLKPYLQRLFAERFHLKVHHETKIFMDTR